MASIAEKTWNEVAPVSARSARWALASLSLSTLLSSLATSIASVGLPSLMQAFGASFQLVQWVVLAYLLAITTLIVSAGRLADIFGRRPLLLGGIALFTFASVLCGLAPTLWLLIAARAAQGLGAAVMMALTLAFVADTVPREKTGSAIGLLGAMSAIGTTLGPSLGGLLIAGLGWRAIFLINLPLGALAFALAWRVLPAGKKTSEPDRRGFDGIGTALLALTLAAYALAMTLGRGSFGSLNVGLLIAAAVAGLLFVIAQTRAENPLIQPARFRDQALNASLAMNLIVATVMMATLVVAPFYLSRALGLDAAMVGLVLSTGPLVTALAALPAGRLVDRFGARRMMIVGLFDLAIGTFALSRAEFGIAGYVVPIIIACTGYSLFQTSNNSAVMTGVASDQRGVVSGLLNLSRNLGLITGASVMGAVFAFASAGESTGLAVLAPAAAARGMQVTFQVATGLVLMALILAIFSARTTAGRTDIVAKHP
ncbi:MFS transporter [Mesorhizobium sp. M1378]|uniref:MFS transporter n=1 Tax=Mesorhizobium sp. M1378 TaxID=2957092 RepID=UPI00333BA386